MATNIDITSDSECYLAVQVHASKSTITALNVQGSKCVINNIDNSIEFAL